MNRMIRLYAALPLLFSAACDRTNTAADPVEIGNAPDVAPPSPVASEKSIMRPAIAAEADPVPVAPAAPTLVTIPFAYDGAKLDDAARGTLDRLARDPATAAVKAIVVRGHTDASGSDRANLHVSLERATVVRDYLVEAQVKAPITVIAMGERRPLRPGATMDGADDPAGRAANRRVEITLR